MINQCTNECGLVPLTQILSMSSAHDMNVTYFSFVCIVVLEGVGGNLVAVQASRLSTGLHQLGKPGQVQESSKFQGCIDTFFGSGTATSYFNLFVVY